MRQVPRIVQLVLAVPLIATTSLVLGSCRQPAEPEPVERPPMVVENEELGLRLAGVPGEFLVVMNDGSQLILDPSDGTSEGEIFFTNNPPEAGQNIPAEVDAHKLYIESQDEAEYLGRQELISQLGTTYYSRGRFATEGSEIEETVIFTLHPYADRILSITYRYPAGADSSVRVQQLLDVLATVEGIN